jgi:Mg-chelatase subunit ChlI
VDEVDKLPTLDREILLSPADEYSRTSIVKHGIARVEKVNTKIFAAANPPKERFSSQFLDRFWVMEFPPYTEQEFLEVSQNILVKRRGIDSNLAEQISLEVWKLTRSIRDSLRIAEAIKAGMNLEKCTAILAKYNVSNTRLK